MPDEVTRCERARVARILARYKRAVLLGRADVTHEAARRLVGPDSAYHLYGRRRVRKRASGRRTS